MIQPQTYLTVADNGSKKNNVYSCFRNNRKYAAVGDVIIGVVKKHYKYGC